MSPCLTHQGGWHLSTWVQARCVIGNHKTLLWVLRTAHHSPTSRSDLERWSDKVMSTGVWHRPKIRTQEEDQEPMIDALMICVFMEAPHLGVLTLMWQQDTRNTILTSLSLVVWRELCISSLWVPYHCEYYYSNDLNMEARTLSAEEKFLLIEYAVIATNWPHARWSTKNNN